MTGSRLLAVCMLLFALAAGIAAITWWETVEDIIRGLGSTERMIGMISHVGPYLVVLLMALAIVAGPVPSGPIALAAGAVYGTAAGGVLVWTGAMLGAVAAFLISRKLGYRALQSSSVSAAVWVTRPRPQGRLMLVILASRLVPFISFDAVSYVAGLTSIATWRFVAATALGVLPACFAYTAMGAGMKGGELNWVLTILVCAITLLLPAGVLLGRAVCSRFPGAKGV